MDSEKFVPEEAKEEYRTIKIGGKEVKIEKPKKIESEPETEVEHVESLGETEIILDPGWHENDEELQNKQENKEK